MTLLSTNILTITEPTIELEPLEIVNVETEDIAGQIKDKASKSAGDTYPLIRINKYTFEKEDIVYFELDVNSFLPKLTATIIDVKGVFTVSQFPKDGDVLELLIQSRNNVYKPIRIDFDILDIDGPPVATEKQGNSGGINSQKYTFECQMKVPRLLTDTIKSYGKNTSYNHFNDIADDLKLGFASNINSTDDEMIRFIAGESRINYINRLTEHCYKDENSFFISYIDLYYYLNLVNLNQQLVLDENVEDSIINLIESTSKDKNFDDSSDNITRPLLLSNRQEGNAQSSQYISKYNLINKSGLISLKNGYMRKVQYYDNANREYLEFDLDTLTSDNLPDNYLPLKGKSDEKRYLDEIKLKYLGLQSNFEDNGNVHLNYKYAKLLNYQNYQNIQKLALRIVLPTANMTLYKNQRVPVALFDFSPTRTKVMKQKKELSDIDSSKVDKAASKTSDKLSEPVLNIFYSGFYIIGSIKYIYAKSKGFISQELILNRREWPVAP